LLLPNRSEQADGDVLAVAGTAIKIVRLSSDGSKPHILKKLAGHPITVRLSRLYW
jgi:hypothetical protein